MSDELKGCPFCGSNARTIDNTSDVPTWAQCNNHGRKKKGDVRCVMSHTIIPIEAWNRRAPLPAEQPSNPTPRKREILAICDAYESGIGHGLQRDGHSSGAIWSDPECGQAYELGYAEGLGRSEPEARIVGQQTKGGGK